MAMKDSKYVPVRESTTLTVGALAAKDVVIADGLDIEQSLFITRTDVVVTFGGTIPAGFREGLLFGIADGDLTAEEIEECLETNGPVHNRDQLSNERSRRRVQWIGPITPEHDGNDNTVFKWKNGIFFQHNTRMGFSEDATKGWVWWVYNLSDDAIDTGIVLQLLALHHGRWN